MISPDLYNQTLRKVAMVFQGRSEDLISLLYKQMEKYSLRLEYEKAAEIRDQIKGLKQVQEDQKMILPDSTISMDIVGMAKDEKIAVIQIFQMRSGKLVGRLGYISDANQYNDSTIIKRIIEEHNGKLILSDSKFGGAKIKIEFLII